MNQPNQRYTNNYNYQQQYNNTSNQYNQGNPQNQFQTPQNYGFVQNPYENNNANFNRQVNNAPYPTRNVFILAANRIAATQAQTQPQAQQRYSPPPSQPLPQPSTPQYNQYQQPPSQPLPQPSPPQYNQYQPPPSQPLPQPSPPQYNQQQYQPPPPPPPPPPAEAFPQQQQSPPQPPPPQPSEVHNIYDDEERDIYATGCLDYASSSLYDTQNLISIGPTIRNDKLRLNANQKINLFDKIHSKFNKFIDKFNGLDKEQFYRIYDSQKMEWKNICDYLTSISTHLEDDDPYKIIKKWAKKYKKMNRKKIRQELMLNENLFVQHRDLAVAINKIRFEYDLDVVEERDDDYDDSNYVEPKVECQACMLEVYLSNAIVLGCKEHHTYCKECFKGTFIVSINRGEIVTCPFKDNYTLTLDDFDRLYENEPPDFKATLRERYCDILNRNEFEKNFIGCPVVGCKGMIHKDDINERANYTCNLCGFEFCPNCKKMHHGKTRCDDYAKYSLDYLRWESTGRELRLREKGIVIAATREAEEKQRKRSEEIQQRLRDLQADENWKAQNCRYCPSCGRVVYKVDGCDLMVCGRNYHGGDAQNGCGNGFRWSEARPYQPNADFNPQNEDYRKNIPPLSNNVTHNSKFRCGECKRIPIVGIRFKCLNCDGYYLCEECECKEEVRERHKRNEKESHVFQLMNDPNME